MVNISEFVKEDYETDITIDHNSDDKDVDINIVDLFKDCGITETSSGWKMDCISCGAQGGRTSGFILFPETNSAYCHSSGKWFRLLETYALKKKIISCLDGREKGEIHKKVLEGELFTMTLEEFRNEFGTETYNKMSDQLHIKASIELPGNDNYASSFADKLGEIYKSRNVLFYRGESKEVVEIRRYKNISKNGEEYVENGFNSVEGTRLVTLIEMFVKPWTTMFLKNGNKMRVNKSMTQSIGAIVLKSSNFQNRVPPINRIFDIPIPILYKKQLTFPKPGYDKRFGSWLPFNSPAIIDKNIPLEQAKKNIETIFEEFCFAEKKDKIHAIAGLLTPFLHGLLPKFSTRTPVFIYMANRERAGKDYCAGCTGMLYEAAKIEQPAICNDETGSNNEELRKKITACMRQGKKRFHSANNKGLLNNSIFEGVTTAESWEDRILGKNEVMTFSNEIDYSLSGNLGIRLTPDMSNRARIINLHLVDEDANARRFNNPDLHGWILKNRELILSSLYTLVKNWIKTGMKPGTVPFTSFPEWAIVCGGIMEAAGYENPCKPDKSAIISLDSETEEMKLLFETCHAQNPDKYMTKKEIQQVIENEGIMPHLDFNERSDQIKFGLKIDKFLRRMLSDIYMEVESIDQRPARRKYKFTSQNTLSTGNVGARYELKDSILEKNEKDIDFARHDSKIKNLVKSGNDGNLGNDIHRVVVSLVSKYTGTGEPLPGLPTLPIEKKVPKVPQEMYPGENLTKLPKLSKEKRELYEKLMKKYYNKEGPGFNKDSKGYLKTNEDGISYSMHRLIFQLHHDVEIEIHNIIHHIDENKLNNNIENLLLTTKEKHSSIHRNALKEKTPHFEKMSQTSKQLEVEKLEKDKPPEKKEKTDRELQFFESPECEGIIEQCTKDQVYKWIEFNQNVGLEKMDEKLGLGCLKHASDLINENKVKRTELGWEI